METAQQNQILFNRTQKPAQKKEYFDMYYQSVAENNYILKNKKDIKDKIELYKLEKEYRRNNTPIVKHYVKSLPLHKLLSPDTADAIHFKIFVDLYEWAGKIREANMIRKEQDVDSVIFSSYYKIREHREQLFREMQYYFNSSGHVALTQEQKAKLLLSYYLQFYKIHSYAEGNTITAAILFDEIATRLGLTLRLTEVLEKNSDFNQVSDGRETYKIKSYASMSALHTLQEFIQSLSKDEKEAKRNAAAFSTPSAVMRPINVVKPFIIDQQNYINDRINIFYNYLCNLKDKNNYPALSLTPLVYTAVSDPSTINTKDEIQAVSLNGGYVDSKYNPSTGSSNESRSTRAKYSTNSFLGRYDAMKSGKHPFTLNA